MGVVRDDEVCKPFRRWHRIGRAYCQTRRCKRRKIVFVVAEHGDALLGHAACCRKRFDARLSEIRKENIIRWYMHWGDR